MRVGVIGGGLMGSGIAEVCARSGVDVTVVEANDERAERSRVAIDKSLARGVRAGKLSEDDKAAALRRMVNALPEEHRTVIDLAYYHAKSVAEIGDILSIPIATVKTRMFYARKKLGEALQAAGFERGWP